MSKASDKIDELTENEYDELYKMLIFMKIDSLEETDPELKVDIDLARESLETAYDIHPNYNVHNSDEDQDKVVDQHVDEQEVENKFQDEEEDLSEYQRQNISDPGPIATPSSASDPVYEEPPELPPNYDGYRELPIGRSSSDMSLHPKSSRFSEYEEAKKSHDKHSGGTCHFHELTTPNVSDITDVGDDPDQCNAKGNELSNGRKYKEALAYYTKAMILDPKEPEFVYHRALAYMGMEAYILCVADCKEAIRKDSKYSKAFITLSEAYLQLGDFRKAERECIEALNLEPDNDEYLLHLLMIQEKMKEEF